MMIVTSPTLRQRRKPQPEATPSARDTDLPKLASGTTTPTNSSQHHRSSFPFGGLIAKRKKNQREKSLGNQSNSSDSVKEAVEEPEILKENHHHDQTATNEFKTFPAEAISTEDDWEEDDKVEADSDYDEKGAAAEGKGDEPKNWPSLNIYAPADGMIDGVSCNGISHNFSASSSFSSTASSNKPLQSDSALPQHSQSSSTSSTYRKNRIPAIPKSKKLSIRKVVSDAMTKESMKRTTDSMIRSTKSTTDSMIRSTKSTTDSMIRSTKSSMAALSQQMGLFGSEENTNTMVLMEIVGARRLSCLKQQQRHGGGLSSEKSEFSATRIDPYCVVKIESNEVHRTKAIQDDEDPIWTIKSKSLCLLDLPTCKQQLPPPPPPATASTPLSVTSLLRKAPERSWQSLDDQAADLSKLKMKLQQRVPRTKSADQLEQALYGNDLNRSSSSLSSKAHHPKEETMVYKSMDLMNKEDAELIVSSSRGRKQEQGRLSSQSAHATSSSYVRSPQSSSFQLVEHKVGLSSLRTSVPVALRSRSADDLENGVDEGNMARSYHSSRSDSLDSGARRGGRRTRSYSADRMEQEKKRMGAATYHEPRRGGRRTQSAQLLELSSDDDGDHFRKDMSSTGHRSSSRQSLWKRPNVITPVSAHNSNHSDDLSESEGGSFADDTGTIETMEDIVVTIEVWTGKVLLGSVVLNAEETLLNPGQATGERIEFEIEANRNVDSVKKNKRSIRVPRRGGGRPGKANQTRKKNAQNRRGMNRFISTWNFKADSGAMLALRFRLASTEDISFMNRLKYKKGIPVLPKKETEKQSTPRQKRHQDLLPQSAAGDINFKSVYRNASATVFSNLLGVGTALKKVGHDKVERFRVQPCPDPLIPDAPKYVTREEMHWQALEPSRIWSSAGHGTAGKIYLEIIGCDDLPNMDCQQFDLTDAFVGVVFEDNMLRTDVIWDDLNPRWMPWTTRAFCLNVRHASSILMIGVFDHDDMNAHDPIGRVVIHTANLQSDTTHTMYYSLTHDPREEDQGSRGTLIIRLRIEWSSEKAAARMNYKGQSPNFAINVDNEKSYKVLRYITRGAVDMEKPSLASVKLYGKEIVSYCLGICYFLDVLFEILLWRGRWQITAERNIWFPIRSMILFAAVVTAIECPRFIVSILFFSFAAIMLSMNYYASAHPNPWKRVKSFAQINLTALFGDKIYFGKLGYSAAIAPSEHWKEDEMYEKLDKLKAQRMAGLILSFIEFVRKAERMFRKTKETFFLAAVATENRESFLTKMMAGKLHHVHMMMKILCKHVRLFRNFINWQSPLSDRVTTRCIFAGIICVIFPVNWLFFWALRIVVLAILGPWMKLVDKYWVHSWYRTKEELIIDIENGEENPEKDRPDFDAIFQNSLLVKMGNKGRVAAENFLKLRDMRELVFGTYSEKVPFVDLSRHPSVPLPQSWAEPYRSPVKVPSTASISTSLPRAAASRVEEWRHIPGQRLRGTMILTPDAIKESAQC